MKKLIKNYSFNAATRQITLLDYTTLDLNSLLVITNVTDNISIYNFALADFSGTTVSGNIITLAYNTTSMSNTDILQIFYDDNTHNPSTEEMQDTLNSLTLMVGELVSRLNVLAGMANSGTASLRVTPLSSVSTPVTGTLSINNPTVADQLLTGGVPVYQLVRQQGNLTAEFANIKNATA